MSRDRIQGGTGRIDADPRRTLTIGEMSAAGFLAIAGIGRIRGTP